MDTFREVDITSDKIVYLVSHRHDITERLLKVALNTITIRTITVKPTHAVTSIKQSPVLKSYPFPALSWKISYELNLV
jgi:hypothetical protein